MEIHKMTYIIVEELESTGETTCKVKGLLADDLHYLKERMAKLNLAYINSQDYFEVDIQGILLLNILNEKGFNVICQSMAVDYTAIGGRSLKTPKVVWTLGRI